MIEAGVRSMDASYEELSSGAVRPNARLMYATMVTAGETYMRAVDTLRLLCGGGVIQLPSSIDDLLADGPGADFRRYVRSPGSTSEERIALFKLAWDTIGTEFAGRHQQYELFYSGGPNVGRSYASRSFNWEDCEALVDRCLHLSAEEPR
jgi:4-hydroxyphenylacetate 3-monooxygenase